ncbi:MAG: UvrB/UvrC motif-containing protein [Phycisphaerales bacterium]
MKHTCDKCGDEATIHEVTIHNGKKVEKHLCEQCASEEGIATDSHAPVSKLLTNFVIQTTGGPKGMQKATRCPSCGMRFADFRQKGLLGCAECYTAFEQQLTPLIERAQEGSGAHIGKVPKNVGDAEVRQSRLAELRKQLAEALAQERYEHAAALRDEIFEVDPNASRQPPVSFEPSDSDTAN